MNYDSQRIQPKRWTISKPEEIRIIQTEHGKSEASQNSKTKRPWYQGRSNQIINQYWMAYEINAHSKRPIFPDWSVLAYRYISEKRVDQKEKWEKRKRKALEYKKEYKKRPEVKAREKRLMKLRMANNPSLRIRKNLSKRFHEYINLIRGYETKTVKIFFGCTVDQLKSHLELQFTKHMTWSNDGNLWHIDHIIPCSAFDHSDDNQVKQCWHYTNLRPLGAKENMEKSDTITEPQMSLLLPSIH